MSSFLDHFGLREPPFSKEIDDKDLWLPSSKAAVVDDLIEALQQRSSVMLTGDPGTGKTCVLRALRHRLPREGFRLTYCHNATLGRRDFYRQLCLVLGLSTTATAAAVFFAVSKHVEDLGKDKLHPVFLLDEAHLMHQDMLDHLHILLNYEWDRRALLSLVLVGLPELEERLDKRRNRSLCSRLALRLRIGTLVAGDTAEYIAHRLKLVGFNKDVFTDESITLLHEHTGGAMRDIDRIATAAMRVTAKRKRKLIERDVVAQVIEVENRQAA